MQPMVLQRRKEQTCLEATSTCGFGWEFASVNSRGSTLLTPNEVCITQDCIETSQLIDEAPCSKECEDVACFKRCQLHISELPASIGKVKIKNVSSSICAEVPSQEERERAREAAYASGASKLGFQTATAHPVVLALFGALHTNDLLDLKARQKNIQENDPREKGVLLPDYTAVLLRCLQVFLGMIGDMVESNTPPFVPLTISEFLMDTGPDDLFLYWRIFAQRFLENQGKQCPAPPAGPADDIQ
eukprot:gnl/MRDRNA2_/MRDRNA2_18133_c0_seq1.p1 gnl/MRDRNA2_/MRDRNA2_18133_c0~~gnl/MRDRNA2_/MRDRNA2_18133_c0_seq1.p1  ORF type:complete len:270 (+),score=49.28 gnl/MRDRNA2_/MRDRNA2_18133_c0_seq1:78-812(+)